MEQKQTFEEFRTEVLKLNTKKTAKIRNSWGNYDIYKHMRRNGWYDIGRAVSEHEFYYIIRNVNKMLAENIANGETVVFPAKMGKLELRKYKAGVSLIDGKLKNTYPISWMDTLRLWYEDEEERKKKTLVRHDTPEVHYIKYNKYDATYENKMFYQFALNRFVGKAFSDNVKSGKVYALW